MLRVLMHIAACAGRLLLAQSSGQELGWTSRPAGCQRHIFIDLGANWANTLRLFETLAAPGSRARPFEVYGFEASPLIQPYADAFARWLNGELPSEPRLCLPRSGSTPHLMRYAPNLGCAQTGRTSAQTVALRRACMLSQFTEHLRALRPDPALNTTELLLSRLATAKAPLKCHDTTRSRFTLVPAAAEAFDGWMPLESLPHHLIRGGALRARAMDRSLPPSMAPWYRREDYQFRVRAVDVPSWITRSFNRSDYVVVKMDIEGAEHKVISKLVELGGLALIDVLALECHHARPCAKCAPLLAEVTRAATKLGFRRVEHPSDDSLRWDSHSAPPSLATAQAWARDCGLSSPADDVNL